MVVTPTLSLPAQTVNQRNFDVEYVTAFSQAGAKSEGVSISVARKICRTSFSSCCGANIIVLYMRENGGTSSLDFGVIPMVISGGSGLNIDGTRLFPTTSGWGPFHENHARYFFGREPDVERLAQRLRLRLGSAEPRLMLLLGASGAGKSSLIRAGLLPAIRTGALGSATSWSALTIRPGRRPVHALISALVRFRINCNRGLEGSAAPDDGGTPEVLEALRSLAAAEEMNALRGLMLQRSDILVDQVDLLLNDLRGEPGLVLFIDQLEELFTQAARAEDRAAFLANLLYALNLNSGRILVLATMRTEFLQAVLDTPDLGAMAASSTEYLLGMGEGQLRQAICAPARLSGKHFGEGLADTLVEQLRDRPGDLPLLQFALEKLWQASTGEEISWATYRRLNGLSGLIERQADQALQMLTRDQRKVAASILLSLVLLSENGRAYSSRESLVNLKGLAPDALAVLRNLVGARILVEEGGEVELGHEALIERWPTLRFLISDQRECLIEQQRLRQAAMLWHDGGRRSEDVSRGTRLDKLKRLVGDGALSLNELTRAFFEACCLKAEQDQVERQVRADHVRRLQASEVAERANRCADNSASLLARDPERAAQVALEAVAIQPTFKAMSVLSLPGCPAEPPR